MKINYLTTFKEKLHLLTNAYQVAVKHLTSTPELICTTNYTSQTSITLALKGYWLHALPARPIAKRERI